MLPFNTRAVVGLAPKADAYDGTVTSNCISMKDYHTVQGVVARGVSSAAAVAASVTIGSGNGQIVFALKTAGSLGNGKSVTIQNGGPNNEFSAVVDEFSLLILPQTDENGDFNKPVSEMAQSLTDNYPEFGDFWTLSFGVGDGSEPLQLSDAGTYITSGGSDGTPGTCLITVEKCLTSAGTSAEAIEFLYRKVSSAGVTGALTRATTAGFTTAAEARVNYEIIVDDKTHGMARGDKPFLRIKSVEIQNIPVFGAIVLVASDSRYGIAGSVI